MSVVYSFCMIFQPLKYKNKGLCLCEVVEFEVLFGRESLEILEIDTPWGWVRRKILVKSVDDGRSGCSLLIN